MEGKGSEYGGKRAGIWREYIWREEGGNMEGEKRKEIWREREEEGTSDRIRKALQAEVSKYSKSSIFKSIKMKCLQ